MILIKEKDTYKELQSNDLFLKQTKGIYRLYVKKELFDRIISILNIRTINHNLIETLLYEEEKYNCVYVGQTTSKIGYYGRIVKGHMKGKTTLHKSFEKILKDKNCCETLKNECIFLIEPKYGKDLENINKIELEEINKYFHTLNFDDNRFYLENSDCIDSLITAIDLRK